MATNRADRTDEQLAAEVREWLAAELPAGWMEAVDAGDDVKVAALRDGLDERAWLTALGDAGWSTPTWPAEYDAGSSLDPRQARIVTDLLARYGVPRSWNILGLGMGGPVIIEWGTEEQKHALLRGIATTEEIWCQLFSEPGAGSDLAALATRAERDGDEWIVNGQKVWTTMAHEARYGMLVARTDPDQPKHRGLTYFIVDMHLPGVEVRPLVQITGDAEFNEVFFTDVRVPDSMRVGGVGDGWGVAITTLMNERVSLSGSGSLGGVTGGRDVGHLIRRSAPVVDATMRQRLAQAWMDDRVIALNNQRAADKRRSGAEAGPEGSITKLQQAKFNQRLQNLAVDLLGARGGAWEGDGYSFTRSRGWAGGGPSGDADRLIVLGFLRSQANTIEGGTSDIMRNILGERVLGLPKEPDVSKGLAWRDLPRSG